MAKQKLTKDERLQREDALADTMFYALSTPTEEHAVAWAKRATKLMEGLSQSSIKRAQRRANKLAEGLPPGFVKATEAMTAFDDVMRRRKITRLDEDIIWGAVAQLYMFQLSARRGRFYDAALDFKLAHEPSKPVSVAVVIDREFSGRDANVACDCPNCRPRAAEELN